MRRALPCLALLLVVACDDRTDHYYACQGELVCTVLQTGGILVDDELDPDAAVAFQQTCLREELPGAFREGDSDEGLCDEAGELCFWLWVDVDDFRIKVNLHYREDFEELTGVEPARHCLQMRAL